MWSKDDVVEGIMLCGLRTTWSESSKCLCLQGRGKRLMMGHARGRRGRNKVICGQGGRGQRGLLNDL